jgi:hypothetical protein
MMTSLLHVEAKFIWETDAVTFRELTINYIQINQIQINNIQINYVQNSVTSN